SPFSAALKTALAHLHQTRPEEEAGYKSARGGKAGYKAALRTRCFILSGLSPGSHAAKERLDVAEAFLLIPFCHTGRGSFVGSGTVEDDLAVLSERSDAGFKLVERDGSLKMILAALLLAVISTHEQCARV